MRAVIRHRDTVLTAQCQQFIHLGRALGCNTLLTKCRKDSRTPSTTALLARILIALHRLAALGLGTVLSNHGIAFVVDVHAALLLEELGQHKLHGIHFFRRPAQQPTRQQVDIRAIQRQLSVKVHVQHVTEDGTLQP